MNNISRESDTPVISGSDADDVLRGSGIFEGGKGNDTIYAEEFGSEDTLRFNLGDGQDTIISDDWDQVQDTVQFGKGITQEMVGFVRSVDDLIVTVGDNGDQMTFRGFFAERDRQTFTRFEFADGSVWRNIRATEQWKSIDFAPVTRGTDADDRLRGSGIIEGGKGNDTLYADEWGSKDTLRFNLGDGQDTIYSYDLIDSGVQDIVQFGKGITQEMVGFARSGDNLVVMVGDSGDQMTFRDFFADTSSQTFTRFEFTDGSAWSNIQETARWKSTDFTPAIRGTDGNDVLRGGGIFEGGKGNDTIFAQELNSKDTLRFNLGDGQDTIYSRDLLYSGVQDTVQFGKGITQEMIDFVRAENGDLLVKVGNQGDQMTFRNFFADKNSQTFTRFEFADGSAWSNIRETAQWNQRGTDGDDNLLAASGLIEGGKGNDTLYVEGQGKKDTLRFNLGDGQDTIFSDDARRVQDSVQFGKGITHDMIGFTRSKYDLIVTVGDKGDQMTFRGFFTNSSRQTFTRFEFADKSVWGNIKESKTWKESIDKPAYSANDMPRPASSFGLESSVANQANSLLTAMATFAPQEGGIGFLPENNAQSAPILSASSVS